MGFHLVLAPFQAHKYMLRSQPFIRACLWSNLGGFLNTSWSIAIPRTCYYGHTSHWSNRYWTAGSWVFYLWTALIYWPDLSALSAFPYWTFDFCSHKGATTFFATWIWSGSFFLWCFWTSGGQRSRRLLAKLNYYNCNTIQCDTALLISISLPSIFSSMCLYPISQYDSNKKFSHGYKEFIVAI